LETESHRIHFKRNRFSTWLPSRCLYTPGHFWLDEESSGLWKVGLTGFATRMLGEIVEFDFEVGSGSPVEVATCLGWIEGFKAVSDLYCAGSGVFEGYNETAAADPALICKSSYGDGWLYRLRGRPDSRCVDVHGYIAHLEATIDKLLEKPWQTPKAEDAGA
jgi:glycine cleavage system H protein